MDERTSVELSVGVQVAVTDTLYNTEHYQEVGTIVKINPPWLKVVFEDGSDEWMHPDEVTAHDTTTE